MNYKIISLKDCPELKEEMAEWFSERWGLAKSAYLESMEEGLEGNKPYPCWYAAFEGSRIVGGLGVIENDFHDRKDLRPNVCAVYVEPAYRCRGVAGRLLQFVCSDMARQGISTLYLLTDHTGFYERYGWQFFCMAQGDGEDTPSRLYLHTENPGKE